ncbi:cytochrome b/b6 domain-containing protein [Geobacter hydrogenophilus]|uniref:Cytochrome b561 bacterial/Ni-hydrogenase domain-containing protein n=1 Tax=Geobacter hydrogenophilus TaxID=40983 RepID=A0A9W6LBR6_9BACT|nr:cytochrome b/b6 domain-containing protein [Geobacter hydrogenophilus]MBT0893870.1 cytochrome b/b6 domain-containing protein [Geobacter hydrogenophilus]GLI38188.1 hypothetical protein GHYDROH2_16890 [Geobacter hydrogenophilus]
MATTKEYAAEVPLSVFAIAVHLGLASFGIAAWLTGSLADDYKKAEHTGFTLHSWIGMGLASFILLRVLLGMWGPRHLRFTQWVPYTKERLQCVREDIMGLLRLRLPERPLHEGLAGLVQTLGLLVFLLLALSGGFLFFTLVPGQKATGLIHAVKEVHETGQFLIPIFLSMHGGAVIVHALRGRHLWRKMLFLKEPQGAPFPGDARVNQAESGVP